METKNKIPFLNQRFDPHTFFTILRKNLWIIILIFIISISSGFAYFRYTRPVYKSSTVIQIKNENKTNQILGINSGIMETDLAQAIELLRSNEFLKNVINVLPVDVSYFRQGTFLSTELYTSCPFEVKYRINNPIVYDQKISMRFTEYKCQLSFEIAGQKYEYLITPEEWTSVLGMEIMIHFPSKKDLEVELNNADSEYYFIINNQKTLLNGITSRLEIQILNETAGTILITYRDYNARKAADIANTIAEKFIEYDENKKKESANNILKYIDQQMEHVFSQLTNTEQELHDFRVRNNIVDIDERILLSKTNLYSSKISELETKLLNIDFEIMTLEKIKTEIENNPDIKTFELLAMLAGQRSEAFISSMLNSLQELINRREVLLFDVTTNNHRIKVLDEQIASRKATIADFTNSSIQRLRSEKKELAQRIKELEMNSLDQNTYDEIEYARLLRLYTINENFYTQLIKTKAETMISQAGYVSNNIILEKAAIPVFPDYPVLNRVIFMSIIIALLVSLLFVVVRYLLFNKILTTLDISEFSDIPVIGGIPMAKVEMQVSQVVVHQRPKSMMAEAFRNIRTNLEFYPPKDKCRVITISSTIAGEGKTFVGLNIGAIYAMSDKKVLIMDFDLRKPRLHKCFNVDNNKGVSTIILGKHKLEECINKSELDNLDYVTSGPLPPNPAEFILSKNVREFIDSVKKMYDILIIDTPPIGIVTDALITYGYADNPIYVMRAGVSPKSFIENVNSFAESSKLNNLSIVLNGIIRSPGRYGYGYKTGYGYQYGYSTYGYGYGYLTKIHNSYYGEEVEDTRNAIEKTIDKFKKKKK